MSERIFNHVVFINGASGSGKDTLVGNTYALAQGMGFVVENTSSIDCVRKALDIPMGDKRSETRKLLASIGQMLEDHNEFRSLRTASEVSDNVFCHTKGRPDFGCELINFVHVRELVMMDKIQKQLERKSLPLVYHRLLVIRDQHQGETNNASDLEATQANHADYTLIAHNTGSLRDLFTETMRVTTQILGTVHAPDNAR